MNAALSIEYLKLIRLFLEKGNEAASQDKLNIGKDKYVNLKALLVIESEIKKFKKKKVSKVRTVHTSRTMMFAEVEKVMDFSISSDNFLPSLIDNITGKKSNSGVEKTTAYLKSLYKFENGDNAFIAFKYFWKISETGDKPLVAFIYAINNDDLLAESIQVLSSTKLGEKAAINTFEENINKYHPNQYSPNTRKSIAQNIASSWKQAGFIEGKVKNIRIQPEIKPSIASFAFLLAYLNGDRGEFIWNSVRVKALCLNETRLRALAIDASKRDFMQYQYAGSVTAIAFNNLLKKIGIDTV